MAATPAVRQELKDEPGWPAPDGRRPVFLVDASSGLEARILEAWIERNRPEPVAADGYDVVPIPPSRRRRRGVRLARLEACLASGSDCLLAPLRVAWIPRKRNGERSVRFSDLLRLGDPRDPGRLRQAFLLRYRRDRCLEPVMEVFQWSLDTQQAHRLHALLTRYQDPGDPTETFEPDSGGLQCNTWWTN